MSRLTRLGIARAPKDSITFVLQGMLNLWSYDYSDPLNSLRARSTQLQNACDDLLSKYSAHLAEDLHGLRQSLPQPTRENPFPSADDLAAVRDLEKYIRDIEALRVKIRSGSIPPTEMVKWRDGDNRLFFAELEAMDQDLMAAVTKVTEETLPEIVKLVDNREAKVQEYFVH